MNWTKTPPTKPGWYWILQDYKNAKPEIVKIFIGSFGSLMVKGTMDEISTPINIVMAYWQGPLPVPEPPEE